MVNPSIFPVQRRGPSGPQSVSGGGGGDFLPADNILFYDPDYADSDENGSIADPFLAWSGWTSGVGTTGAWKVVFPGVEVTPGAEALPFDQNDLALEGVTANNKLGSYLNSVVTIPANSDASRLIEFRYLSLESLNLDGGVYQLTFANCSVSDININESYSGAITAFDTSFLVGQSTPEANITVRGGFILEWEANSFDLTDMSVGVFDSIPSAGSLTCNGDMVVCKCVSFVEGSSIEFTGEDPGTLLLDPSSFRSFLDSAVNLINGHIVRDDGSWPADSRVYVASEGAVIDWLSNPRALLDMDSGVTVTFDPPPLTREYTLTTVQGEEGGAEIAWGTPVKWSDGLPPEQDLSPGAINQYRFDYEESTDTYLGYVVILNGLEP